MEEFTHEQFIRALEMNGVQPAVTMDSLAREAEARDKRLQALRAQKSKKGAEEEEAADDGNMQEFSHEDYIKALRMSGKEAAVTPETLSIETLRNEQQLRMAREVAYKRKSDLSLAQQWEKEHEAEEVENERRLRNEMKQKKRPDPTPQPPETPAPPPNKDESLLPPPSPPPHAPQPTAQPSDKLLDMATPGTRNIIALVNVSEDGASVLQGISGTAVIRFTSLDEAKEALASHFANTATEVALGIVVDLRGTPAGSTPFVRWCRESAAAKQPSLAVVYDVSDCSELTPEIVAALKEAHNPPYSLATVKWETAKKYIEANRFDMTLDEELGVLRNLVTSAERKGVDHPTALGQVIREGVDHDLRMRQSSNPLKKLTVGMHWRGSCDLDLACILLRRDGGKVAIVFFAELVYGEAFTHSGDVMSAPKGDAERITVDLEKVPSHIACMYFVINSFSGESFGEVEALDASVTVADDKHQEEFSHFDLTGPGAHRAVILCRVFRTSATSWGVTKVNKVHKTADTARALLYSTQSHYLSNLPHVWGNVD